MRLKFQRLVAAHLAGVPRARPLETLKPLDCNRIANPKALRSAPTAHPAVRDGVNHTVPQILRISSAIPAGLHPASRLNQKAADSEIPADSA